MVLLFFCLVEPKIVRLHDVVSGSVSIAANTFIRDTPIPALRIHSYGGYFHYAWSDFNDEKQRTRTNIPPPQHISKGGVIIYFLKSAQTTYALVSDMGLLAGGNGGYELGVMNYEL
jgi:hypothetical protein